MPVKVSTLAKVLCLIAISGALIFWFVTEPKTLDETAIAAVASSQAANGEMVFWQGGCAGCHSAPAAKGDDRLKLGGGLALKSPFGVFYAPNISQDMRDGIGAWNFEMFANAMVRGVSPKGEHYYPAFPYASYQRMNLSDVADLFSYMKTLPSVAGVAPEHELPFPLTWRRLLGGWKFLFLKSGPAVEIAGATDAVKRGQYLVEGPGHCGECHTARNPLGGPQTAAWLSGAKNPEGQGNIPNITGGDGGISDWSQEQVASMLKDGFPPDFDSIGGSMAAVVLNWSHTTDDDRAAVAAYLKSIPPLPNGYPIAPQP